MNPQSKKAMALRVIDGQRSWLLASTTVEACVTETGGHLSPVTFDRQDKRWQPYSVAPWTQEKPDPSLPAILQVLRGDFFCLPFGGNANPYRGEQHPVHGETANAKWTWESLTVEAGRTCLHLSLKTKVRAGRVDKKITLQDGHNAVYCRHVVSGMSGPMNPGHHAMLRFPDSPESGFVSTSRFVYGQVLPLPFELPENRGYSCLKIGAEFSTLEAVPMANGGTADLTRYPARRGFEDLVMMVSDPEAPFAWTAVAFPKQRFAWFSLKDPRLLRETIFWISNGGRHYPPWNGRHLNVMGLEDVTSYFHLGLAESARNNPLAQKGHPTCLNLGKQAPLVVPYIMGAAAIPTGFDRVEQILPVEGQPAIVLVSASGKRVQTPLQLDFLRP